MLLVVRTSSQPLDGVGDSSYSYSRGKRSSRAIERECLEDIAYRVIAMNERPDHSTVARFVVRHEEALAGVFGSVLGVCAKAGLVKPEVIAVDGSKMPAAVDDERMLDFEQIAREILTFAAEEVSRPTRPSVSTFVALRT